RIGRKQEHRAEDVGVAGAEVPRAEPSGRNAKDAPAVAVRYRPIPAVHVLHDILGDVLLEVAIDRGVDPLTASPPAPTVRHHHDHLARAVSPERVVDYTVDRGPKTASLHQRACDPTRRTAAEAMEKIGHGVATARGTVPVGQVDDELTPAG